MVAFADATSAYSYREFLFRHPVESQLEFVDVEFHGAPPERTASTRFLSKPAAIATFSHFSIRFDLESATNLGEFRAYLRQTSDG